MRTWGIHDNSPIEKLDLDRLAKAVLEEEEAKGKTHRIYIRLSEVKEQEWREKRAGQSLDFMGYPVLLKEEWL